MTVVSLEMSDEPEIIDESIIKKQVKNQLSAVKKVTNKGNTYGKFKKKELFFILKIVYL